jgi:hypothetical protein
MFKPGRNQEEVLTKLIAEELLVPRSCRCLVLATWVSFSLLPLLRKTPGTHSRGMGGEEGHPRQAVL